MSRRSVARGIAAVAALASMALAVPPVEPVLPAFDPEQVQGDTRVTLLEVSRITTFSKEFLHRNPGGKTRAIPVLRVVFRVERLGASYAGGDG